MANKNNRSKPGNIEKMANRVRDAVLNTDESSVEMGIELDENGKQKKATNSDQKETLENIKEEALEELQDDQLEN